MAAAHPEHLKDATPLLRAAESDRADVAGLLLDLGMSPDVEDRHRTRGRSMLPGMPARRESPNS